MAGVSGDKKTASPGGDKKAGGGGDFLGGIKSGIHTRLMSFGQKLLKSGKALVKGAVGKVKGLILGPKVKFKIGSESHELWVEKQGTKNVVMMASEVKKLREIMKDFEGRLKKITSKKQSEETTIKIQVIKEKIQVLKGILVELEKNSDKPDEHKLKEAARLISEVETELARASNADEGGSNAVKFDNWEGMKNHYKGTISKFIANNKPKGSPEPKNWFAKGGTLKIETLEDVRQIWRYTSTVGDTVPYVEKYVQFPKEYLYGDSNIAEFKLESFTGDRDLDKKMALEYIKKYGYTQFPKGYVLHHHIENGTYQLVRQDIHQLFTHYGGHYYNK